MKSIASLSIDTEILGKAKEYANGHDIPLSKLVTLALIGLLEQHEALTDEQKTVALSTASGRPPLSTAEFVQRHKDRAEAVAIAKREANRKYQAKVRQQQEEEEEQRREARESMKPIKWNDD